MRRVASNVHSLLHASLIAGVALCLPSTAEESIPREDQLKAAYLINFAQFVQWPVIEDATLTICVQGAAGVREALARAVARKKTVSNGVLAVRSLPADAAPDGCKMLFVAGADSVAVDRARTRLDMPVLTVSDAGGFVHDGGMIELFNDNNRLRFRINAASAETAGLQISSDLLRLAVAVERGSPQ